MDDFDELRDSSGIQVYTPGIMIMIVDIVKAMLEILRNSAMSLISMLREVEYWLEIPNLQEVVV